MRFPFLFSYLFAPLFLLRSTDNLITSFFFSDKVLTLILIMSDRSENNGSSGDGGSDSELDYEYDGYDRDRRRGRSSSSSDPYDQENSDSESREDDKEKKPSIDKEHLQLCPHHQPGDMSKECPTCNAALNLITDKSTLKKLMTGQSGSGFVSRYSSRCDNLNPTLTLSSSTLQIARDILTKGQFKDRKMWLDILKEYLTLSADQHEALSIDIKTEDVLNKFKREKRFNHVFDFQKNLVRNLKNLRIAQRPIFSLIENTNNKMSEAKTLAEKCGIEFSDNPPLKTGGNVPRVGRKLTDQLHISNSKDLLPRPDISELCRKAELTQEQAELVVNEMESYRYDVGSSFMELLTSHTEFLNSTEDLLIFYSDLYSHCDGSIRELIREKMASIFKKDVKTDVLLNSSNKKLKEKPGGLFGGWCYSIIDMKFSLSNTVFCNLTIFLYTFYF